MLVKQSNWHFRKNVKTCLQNKKLYLMPPLRHGYFCVNLILPENMVEVPQQHPNVTVHWLQALPLSIVAKSSILNVAEFIDPFLKTLPCTKTSLVSCKNQSFFLLFWNVATFIKSHCVFLCYFLQYDEVILISLLDGCYHDLVVFNPVNGCSKLKLLMKK